MSKKIQEKVTDLLKDQSLRDNIIEYIISQDLPLVSSLKLEIKSEFNSNYQLNYDDLFKVLSFYGEISEFKLESNIAFVTFEDITAAYFAQKTLNNKYLDFIDSYMIVSWDGSQKLFVTDLNTKYTCRFDIQIENDKDFQVARRVIGPKGNNMKKIVEMCSKGMKGQMHDIVKLRLRGKGSGFKEGATQEESNEALHLCVSSKYADKYKIACEEISKLILQVYKEYYNYCRNRGINTEILRLKKTESN
jgi:RNA recognition motif. (a.k.a. RRM, RBD, or RNP domain)